jgi:site-specific DNA-adenine methylase
LKSSNAKWILSYDDCKEIRSLYEWACVQEIDVNYTIASQKDNVTGKKSSSKKGELIIRRCV